MIAPCTVLGCHLPTIHHQRCSGNVGCQIGCQKHNRLRNLFRFTTAPERNVLEVLRKDTWIRKAGSRQASSYQPRTYSIDTNSIRSPLICSRPEKSEQARFACVVG